jgi:hypothetical protein
MCAASYVREMTPSALGCQNAGSFIDQPLRGGCFAEVYGTHKAATKTKKEGGGGIVSAWLLFPLAPFRIYSAPLRRYAANML